MTLRTKWHFWRQIGKVTSSVSNMEYMYCLFQSIKWVPDAQCSSHSDPGSWRLRVVAKHDPHSGILPVHLDGSQCGIRQKHSKLDYVQRSGVKRAQCVLRHLHYPLVGPLYRSLWVRCCVATFLNVFVGIFVTVNFTGISHTLVTYVYVCPYFRRIPISVDGSPYLLPRVEGTDRGQWSTVYYCHLHHRNRRFNCVLHCEVVIVVKSCNILQAVHGISSPNDATSFTWTHLNAALVYSL